MTVTARARCHSRNAHHGSGLAGGASLNKYGWCTRDPDATSLPAHYHCGECGACLLDGHRCDARYCSNACRQRAYRERKASGGAS